MIALTSGLLTVRLARPAAQCRKWRSPVATRATPACVGRLDDRRVADRAPGVHDRGDAGPGQHLEPVGEREEGVARPGAALGPLAGLGHGDLRRRRPGDCWPAPTPTAWPAAHHHDGVGARPRADPPGEDEVPPLLVGRGGLA